MKREISALTGLRGIAALWVFLFHVASTFPAISPDASDVLSCLGGAGFLGVDVFFVLSGFVLALNYASAGTHRSLSGYGGFLWKRLARIYPVHVVALVLLLLLVAAFAAFDAVFINPSRLSASGLLQTLTLTHGWSLPIVKTWNTVSWSISCEWAAYLLFPLLSVAAMRLRSPLAILGIICVLFAALAAVIKTGRYGGSMPYGLPRIAAEFTSGVLLFRFWELQKFAKGPLGDRIAVYGLVFLIAGGNFIAMRVGVAKAMLVMPVFACALVYGLASGSGVICKALSCRAALFSGRVSYAFYMVHMLILGLASNLLIAWKRSSDTTMVMVAVITAGLLTLLIATWIYAWIETPLRRALIGWWKRAESRHRGADLEAVQSDP